MLRAAVLLATLPLLAACDQIEDVWLAIRYPNSTILFERCVARNNAPSTALPVDVQNECALRHERVLKQTDLVLKASIWCDRSDAFGGLYLWSEASNRVVVTSIQAGVWFAALDAEVNKSYKPDARPGGIAERFRNWDWPEQRVQLSPGRGGFYDLSGRFKEKCREVSKYKYDDGDSFQWRLFEVRGLDVRIR
ncbi:hypothetical protein [Teichococcus vastitatis]|uniref:Uncharacterized protein n=1 Tax=Teichococcus vastitatis TaxID=2307076 RepID=A0ABS9WBK7_9PROT|nr:hypothetical protein [Pseudoroseomonas vastitatis]MCI0756680.1 hypothetical protein [Pseudoroseomonas vastitatis]